MILLIDNYDSFSYNLYQLVGEIDPDIRVIRNDEITVEEIRGLAPDRIILSPGPGRPEDAGIIVEAAKRLGPDIPLLGVCLGHQAICAAFGAAITYAKELMHGTPSMQLLGVYDEYLVEPLAQVLINLGQRRGMVVYGQDKLDEISLSAPTRVCEIRDGWFRSSVIMSEQFGFARCAKEDLRGGTPEENAQITLSILKGEKGHKRNAVLMNAGAALSIGGKADSMKEGIALAARIIDSGKALETLNRLIEVSNRPEVEA